jgi:acyl-CoA synthetase (AMP-forming)/AMP-acid ligase II
MRRIPDEELAALDLRSLRQALNGAEPVSATLMEAFAERFARCGLRDRGVLRPVYGLAEATLAVTHPTRARHPIRWIGVDGAVLAERGRVVPGSRKLPSVGPPMPGVDIDIRDASGEVLPEGRVGRIWVRSMSPMRGYFADPAATDEVLHGAWLFTGDVGFVDEGELFICGRVKDLIIIRGANHAPEFFEEALAAVRGVRTGWVVAAGFIPKAEEAEALLILAERSGDADDDAAVRSGIHNAVLSHTGIAPHTVVMLPKGTLRRTSSGKIRRLDALDRFERGALVDEVAPPAAAAS